MSASGSSGQGAAPLGAMPPEIAAQLREIGAKIETQKDARHLRAAAAEGAVHVARSCARRALRTGRAQCADVFAAPKASPDRARLKPIVLCIRARRRFRARLEAHRWHAVLRQHRRLGGGLWARRCHDELPPSARQHVAVRHRGRGRGGQMATGERGALRGRPEADLPLGPFGRSGARRRLSRGRRDARARPRRGGRDPHVGIHDLGKEVSVWKVYYGDDVSKYAGALRCRGSRNRRCRCS